MELLLHFAIVFVFLSTLGIKSKIALLASLFALAPDLDVFLGIHKWFLHSVIVLLIVGFPIVFLLRRTRFRGFSPLALLATSTHPMLDIFWGYTPIFWPIFWKSIWVKAWINLEVGQSLGFNWGLRMLTELTSFEQFTALEGPLVTGWGLMISAILISPFALNAIRGWLSRDHQQG